MIKDFRKKNNPLKSIAQASKFYVPGIKDTITKTSEGLDTFKDWSDLDLLNNKEGWEEVGIAKGTLLHHQELPIIELEHHPVVAAHHALLAAAGLAPAPLTGASLEVLLVLRSLQPLAGTSPTLIPAPAALAADIIGGQAHAHCMHTMHTMHTFQNWPDH